MARIIPADNSQPIQEVSPRNGRYFTLQEMRQHIGNGDTLVDILEISDGQVMVLDEEAKCVEIPARNERASALVPFVTAGELRAQLAQSKAKGVFVAFTGDLPEDDNAPADYIAGTVMVCERAEVR